ncbi:dehydrogenase [Microdochium bolleyi]|uniref:Dehydrogenase n=1 Tax=Microdochium bolleyi TaxID=196109 RepID=A0A136J7I0_9PEZI|nr:dehydrogenase [Microdochium bolleyi]
MAPTQQTVLITGCSEGGIGDALCLEFHRRGLRVFATARNLKKVQHLAAVGIETITLDVVDNGSIEAAVKIVSELTGGTLDYLVNNSGIGYQMPLLDADLDMARKLFEVNVWGVLAVCQRFVPLLAASADRGGSPRILNIGSVVSRANAALALLNDTLRVELQPFNIAVLHVVTGGIKTKFYANAEGCKLPGDSMYAPVREVMESGVTGKHASKMADYSAEKYAREVVDNTMSWWPKKNIWLGSSAALTWIGYNLLPATMSDWLMCNMMFPITQLNKAMAAYKGGQRPVEAHDGETQSVRGLVNGKVVASA